MKIIAKNKKAGFEYFLFDEFEAGIVLEGREIKSLRLGKCNIEDAYIDDIRGEMYLVNCNISEYKNANNNFSKYEAKRRRKLLLKKREINKFIGKVRIKGMSIIPLSIYFNDRNFVKVRIAIAKGKKLYDKRESIKERELNIKASRGYEE